MNDHCRIASPSSFDRRRQCGGCVYHDEVSGAKEAAQVPKVRMMQPVGLRHKKADTVSLEATFLGRLGSRKLRRHLARCARGDERLHHTEPWAKTEAELR